MGIFYMDLCFISDSVSSWSFSLFSGFFIAEEVDETGDKRSGR
jgi:hypothetical protein